ncbi:MAG: TIGR00159 family protein [Chloroflexi bacterium]|nr:MAG: TIGR00159 family protein [Chloroflexota bacterium]HDN80983.1 TIGR00159 family protein [Chloroflexota bacterium]
MAEWLEIFKNLSFTNVLDILLVTLVFYLLLRLIQGTQAVQLLRGIVLVVFVAMITTALLPFTAFRWLVHNSLPALLVALPVVFQPELRRALERLGRAGALFNMTAGEAGVIRVLNEVSLAAGLLSGQRYGALIVIERGTGLQEYAETGVILNAKVSKELLLTIFFPGTALHDGAVIIRNDKVLAAACVLPLSSNPAAYRTLGTRHKAAIGITEQSDAVAVVVSEETGTISVAYNGRMIRHLDEKRLRKVLQSICKPPQRASLSFFKAKAA